MYTLKEERKSIFFTEQNEGKNQLKHTGENVHLAGKKSHFNGIRDFAAVLLYFSSRFLVLAAQCTPPLHTRTGCYKL